MSAGYFHNERFVLDFLKIFVRYNLTGEMAELLRGPSLSWEITNKSTFVLLFAYLFVTLHAENP